MGNRKVIYLDDAIDALERKKDKKAKGDIGGFYNKIIQNDIDALMQLPSVQPERKTGHWEIYIISMLDGEGCRCSKCRSEGVPYWDFCPSCGANMREKYERLD